MGLSATTNLSANLELGEQWLISVEYRDLDGCLSDDTPAVVVTLPNGSTDSSQVMERVRRGHYRLGYTVETAGRYLAQVSTATDAVDFAAYATGTTNAAGMPDVDALNDYMGTNSYSDARKQDALDAEAAAQRKVCRVGAVYEPDLREALLRRAQRNLEMRRYALGVPVPSGDSDTGPTILPGRDPEVRRLEGPYRKVVVA